MKKRHVLNHGNLLPYFLVACFAIFSPPLLSPALQAAPVTWGTPTTVSTVNDISLNGTLIHAGSWGTSNLTVDVSGMETILFEDRPINTTDGKAGVNANGEFDPAYGDFYTNDTGNANFNDVMDSMAGGQTKNLILEDLVPGATYEVQLFVADQRSASSGRTMFWSDNAIAGVGNESAVFTRGETTYTIGTFVADNTSQRIYGLPDNDPDTLINGYVLRLTTPAPLSIYIDPQEPSHLVEGDAQSYELHVSPAAGAVTSVTVNIQTPSADLEVSTNALDWVQTLQVTLDSGTSTNIHYRAVNDAIIEPTEIHQISHSSVGLTAVNAPKVTVSDALIPHTGDYAIYTSTGSGNQDLGDGERIAVSFSTVEQAPVNSYTMDPNGNGQKILLSAGRHLVLYSIRVNHVTGPSRAELLAHLSLDTAGSVEDLAYGWSQGFIRNASGADECVLSGAAVISSAAHARLSLHTERSDGNVGKTVRIPDGGASIQIVKLDDHLDALRITDSGNNLAATNTFASVSYDQIDEASGTAMGFTAGTSTITLNNTANYLVLANTHLDRSTLSTNGTRNAFTQRLLLNTTEVVGSKTTTYIRGEVDEDACYQGTATIGMILAATSGDSLQLQLEQEGTETVEIVGARTGLSIVELPATGEFIRLEDTTGQDMNPATRSPLAFNTQAAAPAAVFSHVPGSSQITVQADGPYLFLRAFYSNQSTAPRQISLQDWSINGILQNYGNTAQYARNEVTFRIGNWSGAVLPLASGDFVEASASRLAAGGLLPGDLLGLQGVSMRSLSTNAVLTANTLLTLTANSSETLLSSHLSAIDDMATSSAISYILATNPNRWHTPQQRNRPRLKRQFHPGGHRSRAPHF